MAVDPRQVLAAFLTISMFAMLGNMIKKDHFDNAEVGLLTLSSEPDNTYSVMRVEDSEERKGSKVKEGPWSEYGQGLKTCWNKPAIMEAEQPKGYITFSLTGGPEYHVSQVSWSHNVSCWLCI
uniref:Protein MANNAN SYNTHESIS-RELATED 2 n=1 Tax=Elaeis guineensis var. tenera TaxID=51953 RepID=A0A6I9QL73_ELAGV|nr:protein MANNAN SYNTHESIS-RELATED 2 [Elaeis guineensis]XP_010911219.1 protein MANNAN SYNTHESIS-RELATED 2 [Elaeis guineensis]